MFNQVVQLLTSCPVCIVLNIKKAANIIFFREAEVKINFWKDFIFVQWDSQVGFNKTESNELVLDERFVSHDAVDACSHLNFTPLHFRTSDPGLT